MNIIRSLLYHILGKQLYFRLVSWSFLVLYRTGLLRLWGKFSTHYLVNNLISKGDTVIDIGANLGYYTSIFARAIGKEGVVYAVEPVAEYQAILASNTKRFRNVEILPFALSSFEGETEMGIPSDQKFRHGLTKILDDVDKVRIQSKYIVNTRTPDSLFEGLKRLEYIKCDIEGYEKIVIPEFNKLIEKFKPIVQIEVEKSNFELINTLFSKFEYKSYLVSGNRLKPLNIDTEYSSDIIYLPQKAISKFSYLFK